jgi:multidrug efflux pump subunit AcrA (membrane-fusion protein)
VDALPDKVFKGSVVRITPSSQSESGVVNYPVTVQLTDTALDGVRPGMTSLATFAGEQLANSWLVPTNALVQRGGNTEVLIVRNGQRTPIPVTVQGAQGEWTVVQSDQLQAGDQAIGGVSSFLNQGNTGGGFGPGGGFRIPGGGGRPD